MSVTPDNGIAYRVQAAVHTALTTGNTGAADGVVLTVVKSTMLDKVEAVAPNKFPAVVVGLPREVSSVAKAEHLVEVQYKGELLVYVGAYATATDSHAATDQRESQVVEVVRRRVWRYSVDKVIALWPGFVTVTNDGLFHRGQEVALRLSYTATCVSGYGW